MLEVQNLSYSTKTFSMENVSFSLDDGYLMTLLGRNGAGKTTLFDLVYGRIEPLSGKVLWNDIDVTGMKAIDILYHDEVAYVGGRSWCIGGIRADENIRLLSCLYSRWDQKHFDEMLEMMEFTKEEYTTKFEELSTGNQMQLQLAFALARHPKLLLLDEHTAALDPKTAAKVLEATDRIVGQDNLTTLMITHNMKDAIAHGNRLVMMYEGHIIYDVAGEEKKKLHVSDLLEKFEQVSGGSFANDRMILS